MRPLIRRVLGRNLRCLPDQSAPDMDIAAVEKRRCNAILGDFCKFKRGLDAFAGVGVSSCYWSRCTEELYLVESRVEAVRVLRRNLQAIKRRGCRLHLVAGTAHDFVGLAIARGIEFDLVDCDPFGTCYDLLPLVKRIVPRGVVCITSGEVLQVYRGLNRQRGRPPADEFRGRRAVEWVRRMLLPELQAIFDGARLVHFYVYPSSVRVILATGGFPLSTDIFRGRPTLLGWFASEKARAPRRPHEDISQIVG